MHFGDTSICKYPVVPNAVQAYRYPIQVTAPPAAVVSWSRVSQALIGRVSVVPPQVSAVDRANKQGTYWGICVVCWRPMMGTVDNVCIDKRLTIFTYIVFPEETTFIKQYIIKLLSNIFIHSIHKYRNRLKKLC